MSDAVQNARALFEASPLKQAKVGRLLSYTGSVGGLRCLDLGGDNGVVSLMLRATGGTWVSGDGSPEAVAAIRRVVGPSVCLVDGPVLPFATSSLDVVVVADYLEHVDDDGRLVAELARVLRPGGRLVVNVPHLASRSLLRHVRTWLGLTDEWHGHRRAGYRWPSLARLLAPYFDVETHERYSRAFSEALDIAFNAFRLHAGRRSPAPGKGPIVAVEEFSGEGDKGALIRLVSPLVRLFAALDHVLILHSGYRLILRARRTVASAEAR